MPAMIAETVASPVPSLIQAESLSRNRLPMWQQDFGAVENLLLVRT